MTTRSRYVKTDENDVVYIMSYPVPADPENWIHCEGKDVYPGDRVDAQCNVLPPLPPDPEPDPTPEQLKAAQRALRDATVAAGGTFAGKAFTLAPGTLSDLDALRAGYDVLGAGPDVCYATSNGICHEILSKAKLEELISKIRTFISECAEVLFLNMQSIDEGESPAADFPDPFVVE